MSSNQLHPVAISGSGLWTPEHTITNAELVEAYNTWAERYNRRNADAITAGELEAKPKSSVEFIEKASGIKQRYAHIKEGILDANRMRPAIPERPDDALSDQAEMATRAARQAMDAAGRTAADIDAVIVERADACAMPHAFDILGTRARTVFSSHVRSNFGYVSRASDVDPFGPDKLFHQNGRRVFKEACPMAVAHLTDHISRHGLTVSRIRRWWLHQANINMNLHIGGKLLGREAAFDEAPIVLDRYANTA